MTISTWLFKVMQELGSAGVDSPRRDALVLLEDLIKKDRPWVLAHHDHILTHDELSHLDELVQRRVKREPLAYIRGKAWFYGRFFIVNPHVLIPRPESENIIDFVKQINPQTIIDVGTGSGCLAISCALELPSCHVTATDVSHDALEVARANAYKHSVSIDLHETFLLEGLLDKKIADLVVANLPYVPDHLVTSPEIEAEPRIALFAGENGMNLYQSFWAQISTTGNKPHHVITESLESQHTSMQHLAEQAGYRLEKTEILTQHYRRI